MGFIRRFLFRWQYALHFVPVVITGKGANPRFYVGLRARHGSDKVLWMHTGSHATYEEAHAYIKSITLHDGFIRLVPDER